MTLTYTPRFHIAIPDFNTSPWQSYMAAAFDRLDTVIYKALTAQNTSAWATATVYESGDTAIDTTTGEFWTCVIAHTSASSGTFEDDRTANPTYWSQSTPVPTFRGTWSTLIAYDNTDFVSKDNAYYICAISHTSGIFATDLAAGNWVALVDLSTSLTAAEAAQAAAEDAQTAAETAETNAGTSETNAAASEIAAAASAAVFFQSSTSMLFFQASAPTSWTKQVTHDNKAVRLVTGTPSTGGSSPFSTVFGKTATDNFTIAQANLPNTNFTVSIPSGQWTPTAAGNLGETPNSSHSVTAAAGAITDFGYTQPIQIDSLPALTGTAASGGSGSAMSAAIDLRVQYVDAIICDKD